MTAQPDPAPVDGAASRWLRLDGADNVRDLGGLPLHGGGVTASGVALRADNLQDLTRADVEQLQALGVWTVVDLRTLGEARLEGRTPLQDAGLAHHAHSLIPEQGVVLPEQDDRVLPDRSQQTVVDVYLGYLADAPQEVVAAVRLIADPASGSVVFHCAAGKDRTGMVAAVVEDAVGVQRDAVVDDYTLTAERVQAIVDRLASSTTYRDDVLRVPLDRHRPRAETLRDVLAALDERWGDGASGGAAGWLLAHGLTEGELASLRARLAPPPA